MIETSFIVIAFNECQSIQRTLVSIAAQAELGAYEIVVVDDGSWDGTAMVVERCGRDNPAVRLVRLSQNRGRGFARSTGIGEARGHEIATVDADIILPADWYRRCRAALEDADAVGGTAIPDGDVAYLYSSFRLRPRPVRHTTLVTGSNALYRRAVFDRVSFDPALRNGEDVALNHAMGAAAVRAWTVPGLYVRHEERKDLVASARWLFESGLGATAQFRRYREVREADLAFAGLAGSGLAAAALARALGPRVSSALPGLYLLAVAAAHLRQKFFLRDTPVPRLAAAILADAALLGFYCAGRTAGVLCHDAGRVVGRRGSRPLSVLRGDLAAHEHRRRR